MADDEVIDAAEAIGPTLEGCTARQKNPHRPRSLAWLSWIVARLGGWNCYYKPPGPKTIRAGWDKLASEEVMEMPGFGHLRAYIWRLLRQQIQLPSRNKGES